MIFGLGNRQKMKEDMSLSNLGTVAFHAAKVPTNVFSSTLICLLTLDYEINLSGFVNENSTSFWDNHFLFLCISGYLHVLEAFQFKQRK